MPPPIDASGTEPMNMQSPRSSQYASPALTIAGSERSVHTSWTSSGSNARKPVCAASSPMKSVFATVPSPPSASDEVVAAPGVSAVVCAAAARGSVARTSFEPLADVVERRDRVVHRAAGERQSRPELRGLRSRRAA